MWLGLGSYRAPGLGCGHGSGSRWSGWCGSMDHTLGPWWAVSTLLFPSWLMVEQVQTAAAPSPYLLCYSCGSMLAGGELAQRRPVVARHGNKGGQGGGRSGVLLTPWSSGLG